MYHCTDAAPYIAGIHVERVPLQGTPANSAYRQVPPGIAPDCILDGIEAHVVLLGDRTIRRFGLSFQASHAQDVISARLPLVVPRAFRLPVSCLPIPNIFCLNPASEMIGVDAGRIVARVLHDFGEFTVLDKVGDTGSLLLASVQPVMSVTVWVGMCRRFMTAFCSVDLFLEPVYITL